MINRCIDVLVTDRLHDERDMRSSFCAPIILVKIPLIGKSAGAHAQEHARFRALLSISVYFV